MNYIKELNAFVDWLETNPLEAITQTLWFHIMAIANKCNWPEWFTVANLTLQAKLGVDKKTIIRHRNILIQKGRIEYISQGKQKAGKYRIISFSGIIPLSEGLSEGLNQGLSEGLRMSPLVKLNKTKLNKIITTTCSSGKNENACRLFERELCITLSPVIAQEILELEKEWPYDILGHTIKLALIQGKRNLGYIKGILTNYKDADIKTLQEAVNFDEKFKSNKHKNPPRAPDNPPPTNPKKERIRGLYNI